MEIQSSKIKRTSIIYGRVVLILFALAMSFVTILKAAEPIKSSVAIIVNKDVADTTMTQKDVESTFLGKNTKWSDKSKVTIFALKSGDVHKTFLEEYMNLTPAKFKSYWKKQVFTGKADAPKDFKDEKEMIESVAKTKGAIGYVSVEFLNKNPDLVKNLIVTK